MTAPTTNNYRNSHFFCIPLRRKRKPLTIPESAIKPSVTAVAAIKAQSQPIDVPRPLDVPPSVRIVHVDGFGDLETDKLSSVTSAASSLQRTNPMEHLRTEGSHDLRDGFYWKQNDDGTWSMLPK